MSRLRSSRVSRANEVQKSEPNPFEESERTPAEPADWSSLADDQMMRAQMRERLIGALVNVPAVYRVPVILRDIQGLTTEEASAVLRVKTQTLKSRLHRGRLLLREALADFAGGVMLHAREAN
jgi:RNA polymerase sigma-70 factor (ECF subfamily)